MVEGRGLTRRSLQLMVLPIALAVGGRALAADKIDDALSGAGKIWYEKFCTPCHGPGGAPGDAVSTATKQPVDLRTYVKRHGGKFPATDWFDVIVGARPGSTHSQVLETIRDAQGGVAQDAAARGVVGSIARYIASVQAK
jgi:hypothetical protein